MSETNKTYRIRTSIGSNGNISLKLDQDYNTFDILSLSITSSDAYRLHVSNYGVIAGRVVAAGNFGVPNAKISVFIPKGNQTDEEILSVYSYSTTLSTSNGVAYNLLPDNKVNDCHQVVGTFPNKTYMLDNDILIEIFDEYYIYTTRTNNSGDYLICGVPTGQQTVHMDLDLSDCGILSQRPRDFVYKGYNIEQFENPNQFKKSTDLGRLSQIIQQDEVVNILPFWGNTEEEDTIGITRVDFNVNFDFSPTCVFMGSVISDDASNGFSVKGVPTNQMGAMDNLTTGEGTIEMIRKTPEGNTESFQVKGTQLIDANGVWCYQIPMNLDYMMTDEYGNMVPTDDPTKGIPTRARVRFRISMQDFEDNTDGYHRSKVLVPNNPQLDNGENYDYTFGSATQDESFRDLFWNNVYTVKSHIPRIQRSQLWKNERFSGIKHCNTNGQNNPMPYNNIRIKLPLLFTMSCVLVKTFIKVVTLVNRIQSFLLKVVRAERIQNFKISGLFIGDGLCPDLEGWYFAPGLAEYNRDPKRKILLENTLQAINQSVGVSDDEYSSAVGNYEVKATSFKDETSVDYQNSTENGKGVASVCLTTNIDYFVSCIELALAEEYHVIQFDFYNDWVNGVIYLPRWKRLVRNKKKYRRPKITDGALKATYFIIKKVKGCMTDPKIFSKKRLFTQQCSMSYERDKNGLYTKVTSGIGCGKVGGKQNCHKVEGKKQLSIFGNNGGVVREETTLRGENVYYLKPAEIVKKQGIRNRIANDRSKVLLFATDLVLLGSLNDCDKNGIPQSFKVLTSTSYKMPTQLALTNMDEDNFLLGSSGDTICSEEVIITNAGGNNGHGGSDVYENYDKYSDEKFTEEVAGGGGGYNDSATSNVSQGNRIQSDLSSRRSSYENIVKANAGTPDAVEYENEDDTIGITEAAGVAWNYTGPGQYMKGYTDKMNGKNFINYFSKAAQNLYYPGGHFMGLSCFNSTTNIKSCINLQRICEIGTEISSRREEIRGVDASGNPLYSYIVPSGLISNDDITSVEFRTMFATLNSRRLIADKVDEETGFLKYDFKFLRPDGFDGALNQYVMRTGSPYNRKIDANIVNDELSRFRNIFGVSSVSADYDPEESENTEMKTTETTNKDYYMFRLGLMTTNDAEQRKKFLINSGNGLMLPQYENSYYFFFGLRNGATALDEFKKQFFSECDSDRLRKAPEILYTVDYDYCHTPVIDAGGSTGFSKLSTHINILIEGMVGPYLCEVFKDTPERELVLSAETENDEWTTASMEENGLPSGNYIVKVTDTYNTEKEIHVKATPILKFKVETVPFRVRGEISTGGNDNG